VLGTGDFAPYAVAPSFSLPARAGTIAFLAAVEVARRGHGVRGKVAGSEDCCPSGAYSLAGRLASGWSHSANRHPDRRDLPNASPLRHRLETFAVSVRRPGVSRLPAPPAAVCWGLGCHRAG